MRCEGCNTHVVIKSNRGAAEEIERFELKGVRATVYRQDGSACHSVTCPDFGQKVHQYPDLCSRNGRTPAGNQRYRCKCCRIRFSEGSTRRKSHPEALTHKNEPLLIDLCNKRVLSRIPETSASRRQQSAEKSTCSLSAALNYRMTERTA